MYREPIFLKNHLKNSFHKSCCQGLHLKKIMFISQFDLDTSSRFVSLYLQLNKMNSTGEYCALDVEVQDKKFHNGTQMLILLVINCIFELLGSMTDIKLRTAFSKPTCCHLAQSNGDKKRLTTGRQRLLSNDWTLVTSAIFSYICELFPGNQSPQDILYL